MAVSATFVADFTRFNDAVETAKVKLRSFETGTAGVEKALSRMTDSFSGRRVIQEATLAAEAVERIGGTTRLTESELVRVGRTAQEAVAKMRALGIEVPPGIQKIADATKDADKAQGSLVSTVKQVTAGFAALFTARAAFNFARDVINDASALKDLSQQTRINVVELQHLAGAMSEFGVSADELGRGLFQLSKRIAKGDDSVVAALEAMGLTLKDVQGLQGEELFLRIEKGLATLQGSLRDTAASELFGDKLGAAMAGASEGIQKTLEHQKRFNTVMSEESVESLDRYGEAIERTQRSLTAMVVNFFGPLAEEVNTLTDAVDQGASKWDVFKAAATDVFANVTGLHPQISSLTRLLDDLNRKTAESEPLITATNAARQRSIAEIQAEHKAALELAKATEKANQEYRNFLNFVGEREIENAARVLQEKEKLDEEYRRFRNEIGQRMLEDEAARMQQEITAAQRQNQQLQDEMTRAFEESQRAIDSQSRAVEAQGPKVDVLSGKWRGLAASIQSAIQLMVPKGFSFEDAYQKAGFIVHNSISGLRPMATGGVVMKPTPVLAGEAGPEAIIPLDRALGNMGSVTINVHAPAMFLKDRSSMQELANILNEITMRAVGGRRRFDSA